MPRHPFRAWTLGIGAGILLAAAATAQEPSRNAPQPGAGQAPAQPSAVVEAPTLVPLLRAMISMEGHLAATPGNQLIVVDRYANVRRIAAIVEELDR